MTIVYDSSDGKYKDSSTTYTGPHTKIKHRSLSLVDLEHYRVHQLESIVKVLTDILVVLESMSIKNVHASKDSMKKDYYA